jgi:hypothetical protein
VGVLALIIMMSWYLGAFSHASASRWRAGAAGRGYIGYQGRYFACGKGGLG